MVLGLAKRGTRDQGGGAFSQRSLRLAVAALVLRRAQLVNLTLSLSKGGARGAIAGARGI